MINNLRDLFDLLLLEARERKNRDFPRPSVFRELEDYKDKDDYYISFTQIEKIGINPQSKYDTPLGIYTYPLKEAWREYNLDLGVTIREKIPFAGSSPNIYLLKKKEGVKFVNSAREYSYSDLKNDLKKLKAYVLDNKEKFYLNFKEKKPNKITSIAVDYYFDKWSREAINQSYPISKLWNVTRNLCFNMEEKQEGKYKEPKPINSVKWNALFRKVLGYQGFADKTGLGYIHPGEPVQAVFFTTRAFEVVKLLRNKESQAVDWYERGKKKGRIKTKDEDVESTITSIQKERKQSLTWSGGDWESGTWKNGVWKGGTWKNGVWAKGYWQKGVWDKGTWHEGIWYGGEWKDGEWKTGIWHDGEWFNGIWKDGTWFKGKWHNGVHERGTWDRGEWVNGEWVGGSWHNGTWHNGMWRNGSWFNGAWRDGTWWGGSWRDGTWFNGSWLDGEWEDGHWRGGVWDRGIWKKGWIYDPEKKGNFKEDWKWDKSGYVKSPISPKEYWRK